MPQWNTISISGYHIREAGSTAAQELAFTLADGMEYVRWALKRGLDIDSFAPRLSFFFNAHNDFFEEIAKYRAARRIWAREMRDTFRAKQDRSWLMRFHTQTAGVSLTAQQPEINIVRVAIQALAAVLGGTQSLHTNSMDEALALPSQHAATIALRTQQIIAEESGVANTVDPLAGSYFLEAATQRIEAEAYDYFRRIDDLGGVLPAIEKGFFQGEISDAAYRYQREIDEGVRKIVGVNAYAEDKPLTIPLLEMDPAGFARQGGAPEAGAGRAGRRAGRAGAGPPADCLRRHREHHAVHPGGGAGVCHAFRDHRRDEEGIWNLPGTDLDIKIRFLKGIYTGRRFMANIKKNSSVIGILTGGGDVPGLNPAIRAVTVRALREGYKVIGLRRGWAGLIDVVRDEKADNSDNFQVLTEEVVNKAGRTGGTFLHTSRTRPSAVKKDSVPIHLQDKYNAETNDLTPEVLKNLDWLGIDYLIPIGGDDTLSYGVRLYQEGLKVIAIPKTMDNDVPGTDYCIGFSHLRDAHHPADQQPAYHRWLARAYHGVGGVRALRRLHRHASHHGRRSQPLCDPGIQVQHRAPGRAAGVRPQPQPKQVFRGARFGGSHVRGRRDGLQG